MDTYNSFISQFKLLNKQVSSKGYHYHHIVPKSEQTEQDDRGVLITPAQHLWAHILYDKEHGTKTSKRLLSICKKPFDYFNCFEKCLAYSYTFKKMSILASNKLSGENNPMYGVYRYGEENPFFGKHHTEEQRQKWSNQRKGRTLTPEWKANMSKSHLGNKSTTNMHWYNNGVINVVSFECPEGFVKGRLKKTI